MAGHICTLSREGPGGIMGCACGMFWTPAPMHLVSFAAVSRTLRRRLSDYRLGIEFGRYADLADAVRAAAKADAARREKEREQIRHKCRRLRQIKEDRTIRFFRLHFAGQPCTYCGDPDRRALDHIIPRAQGGRSVLWNMAPACTPCNAEKGKWTPEQWKAARLARGLPWPPPQRRAA